MRALIIGGVTLATMVVASLLRRWSLTATAEAIGALGVILLGLDAWAVRANDLFGARGMDAGRLRRRRDARRRRDLPRLVGHLAAARPRPRRDPRPARPASGFSSPGCCRSRTSGAITAGLLGTAVGGLAHALPAPWSAARTRARLRAGAHGPGGHRRRRAGRRRRDDAAPRPGVDDRSSSSPRALVIVIGRRLRGPAAAAGRRRAAAGARVRRLHRRAPSRPASPRRSAGRWRSRATCRSSSTLVGPVVAVAVAVALDRWQPARADARRAADRRGRGRRCQHHRARGRRASIVPSQIIGRAGRSGRRPSSPRRPARTLDGVIFSAVAAPSSSPCCCSSPPPSIARSCATSGRSPPRVIVVIGVLGTGIPIVIVGTAIVIAAVALVALARGASRDGMGCGRRHRRR